MKNPNFNREELILCIDLYFRLDHGQMHSRHPEIIKLSQDLKMLNIHKTIPDIIKFRSPNSIALKLANLMRLDKNFAGKGMRMGGSLERDIWKEFQGHRDKLKNEANIIRQLYLKSTENIKVNNHKLKNEFLYKHHKNQETNPLTIQLKKEIFLSKQDKLFCEVCGFDSKLVYGEIGNDLYEIHYDNDSIKEPTIEPISLEDFIVVCCNCHRVLDLHYGKISSEDLKNIVYGK